MLMTQEEEEEEEEREREIEERGKSLLHPPKPNLTEISKNPVAPSQFPFSTATFYIGRAVQSSSGCWFKQGCQMERFPGNICYSCFFISAFHNSQLITHKTDQAHDMWFIFS
jgi:hypothetical protein